MTDQEIVMFILTGWGLLGIVFLFIINIVAAQAKNVDVLVTVIVSLLCSPLIGYMYVHIMPDRGGKKDA